MAEKNVHRPPWLDANRLQEERRGWHGELSTQISHSRLLPTLS